MSFPRYPQYKDSGVEWLGQMPTDWSIQSGRRQFEQRRDPAEPDDQQLSATQKYGVVPQAMFMEAEDQKVTLALSGTANFKHVRENDFVISLRSFQGGIEHSAYTGCVSPAYTVLRARHQITPRFWTYVLKSSGYISALQSVTEGIRDGKNISFEQFGQIELPVPGLAEQTAIAAFLDRETGKIDALVAEQEKLIALLNEKRQAVISHAVTKGLNPDAPMKPSGIEWLGDVPAHWEVRLLKRAFSAVDYGISESLDSEGSVAILRMGNIQSGKVVTDDLKFVDRVDESLLLQDGDLLFNRTNSIDLVGKVGRYEGSLPTPVSFASYLVRLRLSADCDSNYFSYLLNVDGLLGLVRASAFVAIGQCNLNPTRYGEIAIAIPPIDEQKTIVERLLREMARTEQLVVEAERAISLLKERRSALISAAVTGQIDVRGPALVPASDAVEAVV